MWNALVKVATMQSVQLTFLSAMSLSKNNIHKLNVSKMRVLVYLLMEKVFGSTKVAELCLQLSHMSNRVSKYVVITLIELTRLKTGL